MNILENLITKLCATIIIWNIATVGMAIDYHQVVRTHKFDAQSMIEVQKMQQAEQASAAAAKSFMGKSATPYVAPRVSAIVKLHPGMDASVLSGEGFDVKPLCNNFGIVTLSADSLEALAEVEDVERISFGERKMKLMLNRANRMTGVDLVHEGGFGVNSMDRVVTPILPYTGKGVMIGIFDSGFDPNHAMFLDENGVSRFKIVASSKTPITEDSEKIAAFTYDSKYSSHATHVSGIAAGNFMGDNFQLQGVAPGAELAMAPVISQANELNYLTYIADYCQKNNLRLVINMSYGNFYGPHDGSDLFLQALDEIINQYDIVACISSGNDANLSIVQKHTFTSDDEEMKAIYDLYYSNNYIKNYITTSEPSPIDIDIAVINYHNEEIVKTYRVVEQGEVKPFECDNIIKSTINIAKEEIHDGLSGYAINAEELKLSNSDYRVGYIIHAQKGQKISSYVEDDCLFSTGFKNWKEGLTSNGAINELACANEVIAVGAYNSTVSLKLANGKTKVLENDTYKPWGTQEGEITYYSSFGTRYDGQELPHICAPGAYLESSYNRYYTLSSGKKSITRSDTYQGKTYSFCAMGGTSMSSPYMAGIAALWLEADPTLTHREIRDIAMRTAANDSACYEKNYFKEEGRQAGAGKVDAYAGLLYILNEDAMTTKIDIPTEKSFLIRPISTTDYEAFCAGATSLTASIYNMEGKKVNTASTSGNTITFSTSGLPKGIYVLNVSSNNKHHQMKIAVK